jgi:hypothetical protein
MATSGDDTFAFTARECIDFALKKLRVVAANATPTALQAEGAKLELNLMLKAWMKYENLWRLEEESVTPIAATASYTLTTQKPHRVVSARWRNSSGTDMEMTLMTREEYMSLPVKSATGVPTQYYVDYQRAVPVLYIWPVPSSVTTEVVRITSFRRFEDIDSLDDDMDVRQEHFEGVAYNLAKRLGISYGKTNSAAYAEIKQEAAVFLSELLDEDREDEIRFIAGAGW